MITKFGLGFSINILNDVFELDTLLEIAPSITLSNEGKLNIPYSD